MARESAGLAPLGSGTLRREPLARGPDVVPLLVLDGGPGTDERRARQLLRGGVAHVRIQRAGGEAAPLDVAQYARPRARGRDRRLAPQPRERERALGVD